ncbi:hypothetical protein TWF481_006851 [Arthrobotrys musiformis]|uniref:Uncharacterized protein n=1 Tax=Arthrobotrys musiformis TaxID=47236 RepID=A0AAV9W9Q0_9PEZI
MAERTIPPSPYKLITWKHSSPSWASAYSQHTFDCLTDPMPQDSHSMYSLQNIPDYCLELRNYISKTIDEVNAHPSLLGTGCKYHLIKINAVDGTGRTNEPGHGKARGWLLLKLANMYYEFRKAGGKGYEKSEAEELQLPTGVREGGGGDLPGYSEGERSNYSSMFQSMSKN